MRLQLRDLGLIVLAFSLTAHSTLLAQDLTISDTSPLLTRFADGVSDFSPATELLPAVSDPTAALGAPDPGFLPDFTPLGFVSLGDAPVGSAPGEITLSFSQAINNSLGERIAVFENTNFFNAELAFVEVSSDGTNFARFLNESLVTDPLDKLDQPATDLDITFGRNFATIPDRDLVSGFAGVDPERTGTIFDLADLAGDSSVVNGLVDLDNIGFVRLIDVPGDGRFADSNGNPIFDAFDPGGVTGGFDLDAIGVVSAATVPEPGSATMLLLMVSAACVRRKKSY